MQLIEIPRKSRILKRVQFGFLRETYSLNITRGCSFCCVYCYARGYPEAPHKDQIFLYSNLPQKVVQELDSLRRRLDVQQVSFNTATDCFKKPSSYLADSLPDHAGLSGARSGDILLDQGQGSRVFCKAVWPVSQADQRCGGPGQCQRGIQGNI